MLELLIAGVFGLLFYLFLESMYNRFLRKLPYYMAFNCGCGSHVKGLYHNYAVRDAVLERHKTDHHGHTWTVEMLDNPSKDRYGRYRL